MTCAVVYLHNIPFLASVPGIIFPAHEALAWHHFKGFLAFVGASLTLQRLDGFNPTRLGPAFLVSPDLQGFVLLLAPRISDFPGLVARS